LPRNTGLKLAALLDQRLPLLFQVISPGSRDQLFRGGGQASRCHPADSAGVDAHQLFKNFKKVTFASEVADTCAPNAIEPEARQRASQR
jgi:hypothetical protein